MRLRTLLAAGIMATAMSAFAVPTASFSNATVAFGGDVLVPLTIAFTTDDASLPADYMGQGWDTLNVFFKLDLTKADLVLFNTANGTMKRASDGTAALSPFLRDAPGVTGKAGGTNTVNGTTATTNFFVAGGGTGNVDASNVWVTNKKTLPAASQLIMLLIHTAAIGAGGKYQIELVNDPAQTKVLITNGSTGSLGAFGVTEVGGTITVVPEPSSIFAIVSGLAGFVAIRRRK